MCYFDYLNRRILEDNSVTLQLRLQKQIKNLLHLRKSQMKQV
jgi:hypothetical protein